MSSEKVSELFVTQTRIAISVHTADHCEDLRLDKVVAEGAEKLLQVAYIDTALLVAVDRAESCEGRVVGARLEPLNQCIHASDEVNLVLNELDQAHLHLVGECVEPANARVRPLLHLAAHEVVVAGQDHLDEVGVAQVTVPIRVKELDETGAVADADPAGVLGEEGGDGSSVEALMSLAVQPAEGRVGLEVGHGAQGLPMALNDYLRLANRLKACLQQPSCIVT